MASVIEISVSVDPKAASGLERVLGPKAVNELVEDIRMAMNRFSDECLAIQRKHEEKARTVLDAKIVRINRRL